jgi:hypothetical protein
MATGQRYYDFPTTMNPERVDFVQRLWGGDWDEGDLLYGIGPVEYAIYNSDDDVRADPIERWNLYNDGTTVQFEVWPIPAAAVCEIKFWGTKKEATLTQEAHICDLDDTPVLAFSRALLAPAKERDTLLAMARAPLVKARARMSKGDPFSKGGMLEEGPPRSRTDVRFAYVR